jgi:ribosomal protein S8
LEFHAAIHPFALSGEYPHANSFFASPAHRQGLLTAIKNQIKFERSSDYVVEEKPNKLVAYCKIKRSNFLKDIQEYAAGLDHANLEGIYMGVEQSRFNHLIEIHNNVGIYLPAFFFFPMRIAIKQMALPIFIGSAVKLQTELAEIEKVLNAQQKVKLTITERFEVSDEDVEDYEASYEGSENFWPSFNLLILDHLVKYSLQYKLPIFVFTT